MTDIALILIFTAFFSIIYFQYESRVLIISIIFVFLFFCSWLISTDNNSKPFKNKFYEEKYMGEIYGKEKENYRKEYDEDTHEDVDEYHREEEEEEEEEEEDYYEDTYETEYPDFSHVIDNLRMPRR